jgi:hypothetical protein
MLFNKEFVMKKLFLAGLTALAALAAQPVRQVVRMIMRLSMAVW